MTPDTPPIVEEILKMLHRRIDTHKALEFSNFSDEATRRIDECKRIIREIERLRDERKIR